MNLYTEVHHNILNNLLPHQQINGMVGERLSLSQGIIINYL